MQAFAFVLSGLAIAVTGCTGFPGVAGVQGNPGAPIVVSGGVVDGQHRPIAGGASLDLSVTDKDVLDAQGSPAVIYHERFTTTADGTFAIHLAPTQVLAAFAARHGGVIEFDVLARATDGSVVQGFSFPRQPAGSGWAGDVPVVVFTPQGAEAPGVVLTGPGVPVALPVAT